MSEGQRVPVPAEPAPEDDPQRPLWLAVRQGLLLVVAAIERHYGLHRCQR